LVSTDFVTGIDEQGAPSAKRYWKKIALISGGVFVVLLMIGSLAGDPDEEKVAATQVTTERTTTTKAPTTKKAPTTTEAPTTTLPPPTTAPPPPTTTTAPPPPPPPAIPVSQSNAHRKAASYLDMTAFSRQGLIE
jgi:hypothetical protein